MMEAMVTVTAGCLRVGRVDDGGVCVYWRRFRWKYGIETVYRTGIGGYFVTEWARSVAR